jgi:hypothetical protein
MNSAGRNRKSNLVSINIRVVGLKSFSFLSSFLHFFFLFLFIKIDLFFYFQRVRDWSESKGGGGGWAINILLAKGRIVVTHPSFEV